MRGNETNAAWPGQYHRLILSFSTPAKPNPGFRGGDSGMKLDVDQYSGIVLAGLQKSSAALRRHSIETLGIRARTRTGASIAPRPMTSRAHPEWRGGLGLVLNTFSVG